MWRDRYGREQGPEKGGGHREINFFNVMLPVRSLMTEIYICGEKSVSSGRPEGESQSHETVLQVGVSTCKGSVLI